MKKIVRSLTFIVMAIMALFIFTGCEDDNMIVTATISEITQGNSDSYTIKITYEKDSRMENKYVDVQVRCNIDNLVLNFNEEGKDAISLNLSKKDYWHSLTSLISSVNGVEGKEEFKKFDDAYNTIYTFTCDKKAEVDFRVVAGESVENSEKNGQILVNSEPISKEVSIKIKKK